MTENTFEEILWNLNRGVVIDGLIISHLIDNVYYGIFWKYTLHALKNHSSLDPKKMYLIKSQSKKWASIVYDSNNDLHWYTLKKWRGKGIISHSLQTIILPHIYQQRKAKQIEISIDPFIAEYTASKNLALKLGFKPHGLQNGAELYRKSRPRQLNKISPMQNKEVFENVLQISRIISNYINLLSTLSQATTLDKDIEKIFVPLEKKLRHFRFKTEELIWDEEQKIKQS